jgi:O-antigen ligase
MAKPSGQKRRPQTRGTAARPRAAGAPKRAAKQELLRRQQLPASGPQRLVERAGSGIGALSVKAGLPGWALPAGAAVFLLAAVLWATGAVAGSFAFMLGTILGAAMATGWVIAAVAKGKNGLRAARAGVLVALATFVPIVFDPHTGDVYNLPKYTLVVVAALALAGLWAVAAVHRRPLPLWRNGLQWLIAGIIVWTVVSAFAGVDTHVSLLGNYGSYDGVFLAVALGVVAMVAAEAFDVDDVRKVLGALAFAGGGVVIYYGLVQLHDVEFHGSKPWDFITYSTSSFAGNIFSTFGNPNHLGGYLAIIFPIVVVLGLGAKRWYWRVIGGVVGIILLVELVRTVARGAWVAVIVAMLAGAILVIVAGLATFGRHFLAQPLSSLFQSGGGSSVWQRVQIWKTAFHIAAKNPVAGIGPDNFALLYPKYQSAAWVKALGATYLVNGAHNILMNVLADQGFVGLALFLAILAAIALRCIAAWRRCRATERAENTDAAARERARSLRVTLGVVSASITAYLVQALFNVQQVGLSFTFWLLVGLVAVLSRGAGVPDTLRPAVLLSPVADDPVVAHAGEPRRAEPGPVFVPWQSGLAALLVIAAVVVASLEADGPYRADHAYWAARTSLTEAPATGTSTQPHTEVGPKFFADLQHAATLNPWEPTYPATEATVYEDFATSASTAAAAKAAVGELVQARHLFGEAAAREPLDPQYLVNEGDVEGYLSEVQPTEARADLTAAAALARRALSLDPLNSAYVAFLKQVLAAEHPKAAKKTVPKRP